MLKRVGAQYRGSFLSAPCFVSWALLLSKEKDKAFNLRGQPRFENLALRQKPGEEWPMGSQKADKTLLLASFGAVFFPLVSASAKVS